MVNSDQKLAAYTTVRADVCEMGPSAALKLLDVGCCTGALGRSLMAGNPARTVDGIERDPALVSAARNVLNAAIEVDLETFQWGDNAPLGKYDCIIFADVLEHLVDPARHLAGARRHLHTNGSIVVSFPNIRHITVMNSIFLRGTFPQNDRGLFDRTHLRWFTLRDMKAMLAENVPAGAIRRIRSTRPDQFAMNRRRDHGMAIIIVIRLE